MMLGTKLLIVFCVFLAILIGVFSVLVRARNAVRLAEEQGVPAQGMHDNLILTVIFGAVMGGCGTDPDRRGDGVFPG
jgi:hypothetical protein